MSSYRWSISFLILLTACFLGLGTRCFYLQYNKASYYHELSLKQQQKRFFFKPRRGTILDCRARVLAGSRKIKNIFAEPRIIEDVKALSSRLQPILNIGAHDICRTITQSRNPGYVLIKDNVTDEEADGIKGLYGIGLESQWQRYYPTGRLTSHVVGFTSSDNRGLEGLELSYDGQLKGSLGQDVFLTDVAPFRRPFRVLSSKKALKHGSGLILTIDARIQQIVRDELIKRTQEYEAESGIGIVMQPHTGAILAMVSIPDFEPENINEEDIKNNIRNRALCDVFEPGSIMKPIVAAIALDMDAVNKNEKIDCEKGYYHGKGFGSIREYRDHGYGMLNLRGILVKSSNIGMAKIGQRLGAKRLHKGLRLFGFGEKSPNLSRELRGESPGLVRNVDQWTGYSVTRIPFGQEITCNAIQIIRAYCILANGGHAIEPFIIQAIINNKGEIAEVKGRRSTVGYVVKPEVAKWIVQKALVDVINEGTGKRAKLDKWQLFGKTGTANIALEDKRGYSKDNYVASFVAGAPAEKPRIVVIVTIRKPNKSLGKGYTGGRVASPVVAKIIEQTLNYLDNIGR